MQIFNNMTQLKQYLAIQVKLAHLAFWCTDTHKCTDLCITLFSPGRLHPLCFPHPASANKVDARRWAKKSIQHKNATTYASSIKKNPQYSLLLAMGGTLYYEAVKVTACLAERNGSQWMVGCSTSHSTHYRLFRGQLNQLVVKIRLKFHQNHSTRLQ